MFHHYMLAVTTYAQHHRFLGLDWSYLTILGMFGNTIFATRFLVQWIASEEKGESVIPLTFWYWSIGGSIIMCAYWIVERNPVGILGYLPNTLIYMRNLQLIKQHKLALTAAAPSQTPREESKL